LGTRQNRFGPRFADLCADWPDGTTKRGLGTSLIADLLLADGVIVKGTRSGHARSELLGVISDHAARSVSFCRLAPAICHSAVSVVDIRSWDFLRRIADHGSLLLADSRSREALEHLSRFHVVSSRPRIRIVDGGFRSLIETDSDGLLLTSQWTASVILSRARADILRDLGQKEAILSRFGLDYILWAIWEHGFVFVLPWPRVEVWSFTSACRLLQRNS